MTREEAIAIIRKEYLCVDRDCDIEKNCGKCDLVMSSKEPILEAYKMAIKALEQDPCENAISRQGAIDACDQSINLFEAVDRIKALQPVTPQPKMGRWIPVSERLPGDGKYIVTRGDVIGRPMIGMRYFNKDLSKVDDYEFESKKGVSGWCEYDSEYGWYIDDKVTAWMPLPEPYKAESENKE